MSDPFWDKYDRMLAERAAEAAAEESEEPIEILTPGYEMDAAERQAVKGTAGSLNKRLTGQGWAVRMFRAVARIPAVLFVSDSEEGDVSPHRKGDVRYAAHDLETLILFAQKSAGGSSMAVHATWERKDGGSYKFAGSTTFDPVLGREWRPRASTPRPQLDWEKEEGVHPPMGLNQWLQLVAPKPVPKKKEAVHD